MTERAPLDVVVLAAGNDARGDDALGPLLLERIDALAIGGVHCIFDFQFQVEQVLDLQGADLALFIDAHAAQQASVRLARLTLAAYTPVCSHALTPQALLQVYSRVCEGPPPPAFLLSLRGVDFELGADLSRVARDSLEAGWRLVQRLLAQPGVAEWSGEGG